MKKLIAMLSAMVMCCAYSPVCVEAYAVPEITDTDITIENNPELWEKFLKYDLCITDYDSLTDEEKELCRFIFETEQSSTETIRCERARRTLKHDTNIGEKFTLDSFKAFGNFCGILDRYSDFYYRPSNQWFLQIVPDIIHLDTPMYSEYNFADDNESMLVVGGEKALVEIRMTPTDENYIYLDSLDTLECIEFDIIGGKEYICGILPYDKYFNNDNLIENDGNKYYLCPDNTLTLYYSKYVEPEYTSQVIKEPVIIPEEINGYPVTSIEKNVFSGTTITNIILPETIEFINRGAFDNCELLEEINFPKNLKYIGRYAFCQTALKEIKINSPELVILNNAFAGLDIITAEINAKIIEENAFADCNNLESLELGEDVEEIKSRAFYNNNLREINLPENLKSIGTESFLSNSENPIMVKIPTSVKVIGTLPMSTGEYRGGLCYPAVNSLFEDYKCVFPDNSEISGYYGTEAHSYAVSNNLKFTPLDDLNYGDTNRDGEVNIADIVLFEQYLHNSENYMVSFEADVNKDGYVDIFDMVQLRKMLVE